MRNINVNLYLVCYYLFHELFLKRVYFLPHSINDLIVGAKHLEPKQFRFSESSTPLALLSRQNYA